MSHAAPRPFVFDNSYARLPAQFSARVRPSVAVAPLLIQFNTGLAADLGLNVEELDAQALAGMFSGETLPEGAEPLAMAYAGHQFGNFVPQLGDGRAILLGEVIGRDGLRYDIQLKGSGQTPFSRRGDGRAQLGPVLREYVVSEAMAALGVPTTRALAAVLTGEVVERETSAPGAVLTRVARSHIRVGTFQYFAARQDMDALRALTAYSLERHYPERARAANPALALLESVSAAQARLIAHWMSIGFVHGVMNTDNTTISGQTIDYGPCAFLDAYAPDAVFSSIDTHGRYAFGNQARIAQWNLARLAETLLALIAPDIQDAIGLATDVVNGFGGVFLDAYADRMRRKIGLETAQANDMALVQDLLAVMASQQADFTLTFRALGQSIIGDESEARLRTQFADPAPLDAWRLRWRDRLVHENRDPSAIGATMAQINPAVIPRNHQVEAAIQAALAGDFGHFAQMVSAMSRPFADLPAFAAFTNPPAPHERIARTFCGT